jgi:hypothetical protein
LSVDTSPVVTCEDVRLSLNGTYSGSDNTYTFWGQSLTSGSVLAQINLANYYLFGILGSTIMQSTDAIVSNHVRTCELDYSCMRVITLLSGDVIVEGFNWTAGITVQQPHLLGIFRNLISMYKEAAQLELRAIQPIQVSAEGPTTVWSDTTPSYF